MGLMRPGGIIRPNALARRRGLSFAIDFANPDGGAWVRGGGGVVPGTFQGGGARGTNRAGWALTGANGWWGAGAGVVTYSINPTAGTLLVFTRPDFNSNTTLNAHMLFSMGDYFPTGPGIEWNNYVDGNCYIGKIDGSDKRIVASNAGLWTAGDDVVLAYTWNPDGQIAYVNGRNIGSNALTGSSSTSGQPFYIGYLNGHSWQWNQTADGAIYYVLIFDAALSEGEVARAAVDPWWWVERGPHRSSRIGETAVPHTATPGPGTLTLQGLSGTVAAGALMSAGAGTLALQGNTGTVEAGATLAAGAGNIGLQGNAGTVAAGATLAAGAGALAIQGFSATIAAGVLLQGGAGAIVLQGHQGRAREPLTPAPAERTITWPYTTRAATWIAEAREITWPDPGRTVTWRQ